MTTPQEYLQRIGLIVGDDISDGEVNLHLAWNNYTEAKALADQLGFLAGRCQWVKDERQRTLLQERVAALWKQVEVNP